MRGLRNNNPLNIRHSADHWQGAAEKQTDMSFVQFKTMPYGYLAAWKVLESYFKTFCNEQKPYTVRNIITDVHRPTTSTHTCRNLSRLG